VKSTVSNLPLVAIACGGTGGHLYPGMAVGEALLDRGCAVQLLVSSKEVDQQAVRSLVEMQVVTLPAVGLERGRLLGFARGFLSSLHQSRRGFRKQRPAAVLAMGGFTSAPPIVAARLLGIPTLLHEANSIPGRANRWLVPWVKEALIYFPEAGPRLALERVAITGMPVRPVFTPIDPGPCRVALGLRPDQPVLLIMGGSQGAAGINDLMLQALPGLVAGLPELQILHLSGLRDAEKVKTALAKLPTRAVARPFLTEMELALGAASLAICRAGASSIAELAAMHVPAILVLFPATADNHQFYNARALQQAGAACLCEQATTSAASLTQIILDLLRQPARRQAMVDALATWHRPDAAAEVAAHVLAYVPRAAGAARTTTFAPRSKQEVVLL